MLTHLAEETVNANSTSVISVVKDTDTLLSYFPYQVERGRNTITLQFSRFLLLSFKDTFEVSFSQQSSLMFGYTLKSLTGRNNRFQIFINVRDNKNSTSLVHVAIEYSGEKEWIVKKYLSDIAESLLEGISREVKRVSEIEAKSNEKEFDYSKQLNKLSFVSKLLLKSRLVKSEGISIPKGQMLDTVLGSIGEVLSKYKTIYVSASATSASFRLLFINGELKGVYVNDNGKEYFSDENALSSLSGEFKLNVYVLLVPEIPGVVEDESS
ncbi:hypothetical protein [Stygiolobus caldivivus]|uniref:Uncharacterized protein n=1 Tax=Stygiolobus caldivivus TaxID=2824673 RepID=A0A8D5ZH13_9CREN|nr:hypothetical protein [Stygiolobus caldivivus]BCU69299.1 hypothetical protein KN1_05960 [Stygiolobus caldivivus]